ncbi:MAG: hypothetical protein HOP08_18910 [Cyclobacteriaceae bacterium]|nr:hypothetical protein [Cyclobacteriaceae bacterium]
MDNNAKVATEIVTKLKERKLVCESDSVVESKISNGSVRENDWKVFLEHKIRELEKQKAANDTIETE